MWTGGRYKRGSLKTLPSAAEMMIDLCEPLRAGRHQQALAQCAQNLKALAHVGLSNGDWKVAWCYTGLTDPLGRPEHAGEECETLHILDYLDDTASFGEEIEPPRIGRCR